MKQLVFNWDSDTGSALCVLKNKNKTYYGTAVCSPKDKDMMSEKTGCEIAFSRARINALKDQRDILQIKLKTLKEFYFTINTSKWFNKNSYEARRLDTHISQVENNIIEIRKMIKEERESLATYMNNKADFYKKIRRNREKNKELCKKISGTEEPYTLAENK